MGSYEDKYIQWIMLRQQRDREVQELTNLFHTLCTNLGIKDLEIHFVLKYYKYFHIHIQEEMDFLDITSLSMTYLYTTKIEKNFKQKKRDFGSTNPKPQKGALELQNKEKIQSGAS